MKEEEGNSAAGSKVRMEEQNGHNKRRKGVTKIKVIRRCLHVIRQKAPDFLFLPLDGHK